ncbi:MAG TPA: hypothetical protein VLZ07_08910 [Syntrophales bacterium]|nr:hypothetical protein [Syntrophales bacterium]
MQRKLKNIFRAVCIVLLLLSSDCASVPVKNYGSIVADGRAMEAFDKFKVNPNYNYFYSGSEVYPNALIGLDKTYTLDSDLWKKIDMTPSKMKEIVMFMKDKAATVNLTTALHGFAILDDKGKQIGVWYSIFQAMTNSAVRMTGDRTVQIDTPDVDTWLKLEDGGRYIR